MYYIINLETNEVLSSIPKNHFSKLYEGMDENALIWEEESYSTLGFDTREDAECAIKILVYYGKFNKKNLEVIHSSIPC